MAADSYFARRPFADKMIELGFTLVSRLQSNCVLKYYPTEQWLLQTEIDRYFPKTSVGQLKNAISDTEFALRILEYAVTTV
ncbi:MAG: hypothetical protein NC411_06165 [Bacteroides sp.]|nr:hypothetical protein [Bacteroides sp.]